jgi:primosomal protein N'
MRHMYVVKVLPLSKSARTDVLSYFTPEKLAVGTHVEVPFRKSTLNALVTECSDALDVKGEIKEASYALKRVKKVHPGAIFTEAFLETCRGIAKHYFCPVSEILSEIVPAAFLETAVEKIKYASEPSMPEKEHPEYLVFQSSLEERLGWYKTCIRESFARKQSVLCILPTEQDIETFNATLSRGIEERTVVLHSSLTKKEQQKRITKILTEERALLIIGTGGTIAIPREDIHTIILEHESAGSYRHINYPHLDVRLAVELFARLAKKKFIVGDTLIRVETYARLREGDFTEASNITFIPNIPPREEFFTREPKSERGIFKCIGPKLESYITSAIENKSRIFLFTLRNGLATITSCRDCGQTLVCEYCEAPLVLYPTNEKRIFICNNCKRHTPSDSKCKKCSSWNLYPYGIGIDTVVNEFEATFPDVPVFRIDRMSVKTPKQARDIAQKFMATKGAVLIGTEMALHYIEGDIPFIGVVSFDSLWSIPSFRVSERILDLVNTLRSRAEKALVIQTLYPNDELLRITNKLSLIKWFEQEITERKQFRYPPSSTLIKIVAHVSQEEVESERSILRNALALWKPDIFTSPSQEKKSKMKVVALLRVARHEWWPESFSRGSRHDEPLREVLETLIPRYRILINPEDLL